MAVALFLATSIFLAIGAWWVREPTHHEALDWLGRCITIWFLILSATMLMLALATWCSA